MATDRRTFLKAAATSLLFGPVRALGGDSAPRLISCRSDGQGQHFATLFLSDGQILLDIALPARGHGIAVNHTETQAVVFARRPGDFMIVIDLAQLQVARWISAASNRHFYGHGVFSADGGRLYVTENAFEEGQGRIGVYDCNQGFRRVAEYASHGVGPHEIGLLNDGETLVIANGGVRTHPDMPRAKLNLDSMRSSLAYIDGTNGRLSRQFFLPDRWQKLGIRHLDVSLDDRVALAMQYEGPKDHLPPLVAVQAGDDELALREAPFPVQQRMRNYCGSVTFDRQGETFAVSAPRGGIATRWSAAGTFLDSHEQEDVCGVASTSGGFWFSDGLGRLQSAAPKGGRTAYQSFNDTCWDNHLTSC